MPQDDKRALAQAALGDSDVVAGPPARLTLRELKELFRLGVPRTRPAVDPHALPQVLETGGMGTVVWGGG